MGQSRIWQGVMWHGRAIQGGEGRTGKGNARAMQDTAHCRER